MGWYKTLIKFGLSLHLHTFFFFFFWGGGGACDKIRDSWQPMQSVWTQIRIDRKKVQFEKSQQTPTKTWKITQKAKSYKCKEGFDAQAISVIRRRAVKCSGEIAYLLRITCALLGHSCNKYLILVCRCVTDVHHVKTQMNLTTNAYS